MPGAHITIHLPDGTVLSATSDATGHYSFKDVPFGDYRVEVTGIGEGRVTKTIAVRGQNADLDLPVRVISPDLALTGAPSTQEAEWALLLVGLGLLMVLATRRRKKPGM